MGWREVDERLIRRGGFILDLDFLEKYGEELGAMNKGKMGRPFTLTRSHIGFLGVVRYLYGMPYRQLEGFTRALNRLVPKLPSADYSGLRRLGLRWLFTQMTPQSHPWPVSPESSETWSPSNG